MTIELLRSILYNVAYSLTCMCVKFLSSLEFALLVCFVMVMNWGSGVEGTRSSHAYPILKLSELDSLSIAVRIFSFRQIAEKL